MDSRTIKIRDLENKLCIARNHIRSIVLQCAEHLDGEKKGYTIKESWLIKRGVDILESTK